MAKPEFYFNVPRKLVGLWICNTSYTYGVITYGNQFGSTGVATPLKEMKGYFQVNLECYDANGGLIRTSDSGTYGLNTPAYICIDDITIQ